MKKSVLYLFFVLLVLVMMGCKKDKGNPDDGSDKENTEITVTPVPTLVPTPTLAPTQPPVAVVEPGHEGEMISTLSGLWVPEEIGNKRPFAYQFNNFKTVRNQWGISQADIVYEALVEGGITRLLAIGENFTGDRIGSTRSSRHYFVSIADEYDAIYIHFGKTKYAKAKIKKLGIDNLDGETGIGSTVFYRDKTMKAPHNAFASLERIQAGIKEKGFETVHAEGYKPHFNFYAEDTNLISSKVANKITIDFSGYNTPYLKYNSEDKLYYRYQFGEVHKDSNTGKQLAFKNIIVQFVKEWDIDKNDYQTMDIEDASGKGYYITNNGKVDITWKKKEASRWMRYYDAAGNELTINPGKTFIAIFPNNRTEDVVIE
ncbi:MAG TPA: DUF3048 domain-containing protein [Mobilitalea sp.]|nr:DUF3048 domain-containing protein [Mobilitalea sp.]